MFEEFFCDGIALLQWTFREIRAPSYPLPLFFGSQLYSTPKNKDSVDLRYKMRIGKTESNQRIGYASI